MSAVLGITSLVAVVLSVCLTYSNHGEAPYRYAVSVFFAAVYSVIGLGLGIFSRLQPDRYYLFPNMGIICNLLSVAGVALFLHWGGMF